MTILRTDSSISTNQLHGVEPFFFEKLPVAQPLQNCPTLHGTPKVHYHVQRCYSSGPYPEKDVLSLLLVLSTNLRLGVFLVDFPSGLPTKISHEFFSPFLLHALASHPLRLRHSTVIWRRVQVTKLLIMQPSSTQ
jgi:hypothetical protein